MHTRRASMVGLASALLCAATLAHCGAATFEGEAADSGADSLTDGTVDGTTGDGAPVDGGAVDASSVNPCVGAEHWICDTFDRSGSLSDFPFWDLPTVTGGATLTMTTPPAGTPPSPPNVLAAVSPGGGQAFVSKSAVTGSGLHCEVDFLVAASGENYASNLVIVHLNGRSGSFYELVMQDGPAGSGTDGFSEYGTLPDGGGFGTTLERHDFTHDQWTHLSIEATASDAGEPKIAVNGIDTGYAPAVGLAPLAPLVSMTIHIGSANYNGDGSTSVMYDNAFCDVIP